MSSERRALVVDDDAAIRILVTRVLGRHGFAMDSARDGGEAIEKVLQHDYAVIVLDLMMPRIDGVAVVKYLTEHRPDMLARIIVMTAFGASAFEKVSPPISRFIEKPFDIEALIAEAALAAGPPDGEPAEDLLITDAPMTPPSRSPDSPRPTEIDHLTADLRRQRADLLQQKLAAEESSGTTAALLEKIEELRRRLEKLPPVDRDDGG